jgi:UDP-glucose:(heptosyl)LPS alpha-1,3-glucosyltransferase
MAEIVSLADRRNFAHWDRNALQHSPGGIRFAFAIVSLFPGGGLQRDCVSIARLVRKLGHEVTIFTCRKSPDRFGEDVPLQVLNINAHTNHELQRRFSDRFSDAASRHFDLLVGFDKLSGLDVLYCADRSMLARIVKYPLLSVLPRYRRFVELERDCFAPRGTTRVFLLSESQLHEYQSGWATEPARLLLLPPTMVSERRQPQHRANGTRAAWRERLGLADGDWVWIAVGVQPHTKGLDRSVRALRRFANARLLVVGLKRGDNKSPEIVKLARMLGVSHQVRWLGHHEHIPELMAAADLLLHPARYDTTGTVILEAIVNGLPVITTSVCGYATHVTAAEAGLVIEEPFSSPSFVAALEAARSPERSLCWSRSGAEYGEKGNLYAGRAKAAEAIVAMAAQKMRQPSPARGYTRL